MTAGKTTRETSQDESANSEEEGGEREAKQGSAAWVVAQAVEQLGGLVNRPVEHVTAFEKRDDVWHVKIEIVETERIPDSTDILATYEVELDEDGNISGFRRQRRYLRGRADD